MAGDPFWPAGNVANFAVLKLRGSDGAELWRHRVEHTTENVGFFGGVRGEATAIALDQSGNPVAAGISNADWLGAGVTGHVADFEIVKMDATSGERIWRQTIVNAKAHAVAVQGSSIAAAGEIHVDDPNGDRDHTDMLVVKFQDTVGAAEVDLTASADPTRRRLKARSRDGGILAPGSRSPGDPTRHGARLVVIDPTTLETTTLDLPAASWSPTKHGYVYRDSSGASLCKKIVVRTGREVQADCRGAALDLLERTGGLDALAVRLELGTAAARYCMEFRSPSIRKSTSARFLAKQAPAPASCVGADG